MTFDLTLCKSLTLAERDRLNAALALCSARHLADAVATALDGEGACRVPEWTDEQLGQALATAVLLFKSSGGDSARVFRTVLCAVAETAAGRLADERERTSRRTEFAGRPANSCRPSGSPDPS